MHEKLAARPPLAGIFGCAGTVLSSSERDFFADCNPIGFILFARNVESPDQVRALVAALRDCVGRDDVLVLIDQEGGRVARLKPPHWRAAPPQGIFAGLGLNNGRRAAKLNARLLASELHELGINVDCLPLLDLHFAEAHDIIGDRAFGETVDIVSQFGRAVCEGLLEGGILPVLKHIPGHGRAKVDSHLELPVVTERRSVLEYTDFAPFRALSDMPLAMTAHVVFEEIDPDNPATTSPKVLNEIVRGDIEFDGLLMTDDLSMKALRGGFARRTADSLNAGCDLVLHCNGVMTEMRKIADAARPLDAEGYRRYQRAVGMLSEPDEFDREAASADLAALFGTAATGI